MGETFFNFLYLLTFLVMKKITATVRNMTIALIKNGSPITSAKIPEKDEPATTPNEKKA